MRASRQPRSRLATEFSRGLSCGLTLGFACALFAGSVTAALAECKPSHLRPLFFVKTMGPCRFNSETLSFRGTPAQQAMCLMRGMDATRNLGPMLEGLPPGLAKRVGETTGLPSRETLSAYLSKLDLEWDFAANLWQPVARARDNDPDAPMAKYFVIHDTSGPNYGHRSFPDDINVNPKINNLHSFVCYDEWGKAHVVINRMGDVLVNHDFSVPWRETKFEQAAEFGGALKGLFIHNEMIQPRRAGAAGGDSQSPDPAFTPAQYDRLALVYTVVSVRAGRWLIPAFHAALDADIPNGHDDPLNFKVDSFADSIDRLMDKLQGTAQASNTAATATDAPPDQPPSASDGFWIDARWGTPHKPVLSAAVSPDSTAAKPQDQPQDKLQDADAGQAGTNTAPNAAAPSAATAPNPVPATSGTPAASAPPSPKIAAHESEPAHGQEHAPNHVQEHAQEHAQKTADSETCTTRRPRGHLHRTCTPESAAREHEHERHIARSSRHHRA